MDRLVACGVIVTLIGVAGLAWCILRAMGLRKSGLQGKPLADGLQKLIPINMASVLVSMVGLALVLIGRLF
ncbi:MAG: hypothetical protein GDA53_09330 [Rhodobacteraceae bacterium]|nr:hypothetical protein [Paracoccaceae bacterium]